MKNMDSKTTIAQSLEWLDDDWYQYRSIDGGPSLRRLWALAVHLRKKNNERVSDYELFSLLYEALDHTLVHFDPATEPKEGKTRCRSVEDRFVWYFKTKLCWLFEGRRHQYYPTADLIDYVSRDSINHSLIRHVHLALDMLLPDEREILYYRYWHSFTLERLAHHLCLKDRFRARNKLKRVHKKMRRILMNQPSFLRTRLIHSKQKNVSNKAPIEAFA
jgi:hypothetical protein